MIKEYKIPTPGESITEVEVARWMVEDGAYVNKDDELAEVESDKATLLLVAEESGVISIKVSAGQTVAVGSIAYTIDLSAAAPEVMQTKKEPEANLVTDQAKDKQSEVTEEKKTDLSEKKVQSGFEQVKITPVAAEVMKENNLSIEDVINGLRRLTKSDVLAAMNQPMQPAAEEHALTSPKKLGRNAERSKMTMLRRKLSERLVSIKNETAMLTTFNEIDMSALMELRQQVQARFSEKYGFKLGFMGFFAKAVAIAARQYPIVNSMIDGDEIVSPSYVDIGIAVQSPKGLMVPNIRNAEAKTVAQIEAEIKNMAQKARDKQITIEELSGGTISITNGGVFGSLLSTPIINPPQSAILGMHNIVDRPVAVKGQVVIRPMMYVALSYDHRLIDGKDSVGFLVKVKELIENPLNLALEGHDAASVMLDL
jgi:2-oxoglutarate dehydrogenase E2 component (dihydrolipoamide succinyltransferase)